MRLQGEPRKTKVMVFMALHLISFAMVFLQLGFVDFGGEDWGNYFMFSLIPLAVTAFLLGAPYGLLQGVLTGLALSIHSNVQLLDWMEFSFVSPINAVVPLALTGFGLGFIFSRFVGPEHTRLHNILLIAVSCVASAVLFDIAFNCMMLFLDFDFFIEMFIQTGKTPTDTSPYVILCESIVLFVSLMLTDGLLKYVMRPNSRARLHVVFGSRLFCLLLVVFAVVTAAGYALITHLDLIEASEAMDDQLEVIAAGLEASQDHQEYGETTTAIFQTIIDDKDGILVLLDDQGTVIASNDEAYTVGTVLKDGYGSPIMPVIEGIALGESMELVSNRELGIGNDGDAPNLPFMSSGNALNYARVKQVDGYYLLQIRSHEIVFRDRIVALLVSVFIGGIALMPAFVFASRLLHVLVEQPINSANETLAKITDGDLNQEVQLHSSRELASLATYINGAVASLKEYAAESERRIEQDLSTARDIQKSALPRMFPPFPGVDAFDIYASMTAAKYVGGDFYDLFKVDDYKLGFLIADVSGKGIPAALFMMRAKTHISTTMRSGVDLVQAVT